MTSKQTPGQMKINKNLSYKMASILNGFSNKMENIFFLGTSVTQVAATDADVGLNGRVHYELDPRDREEGSFVIDPASGVVRTNKALDRESVATYDLRALAIDGGTPSQSSTVSTANKSWVGIDFTSG